MTSLVGLACILLSLPAQAKQAKDKGPRDTPDALIEQADLLGPLAFSPDGLRIAAMLDSTSDVLIFDLKTRTRVCTFSGIAPPRPNETSGRDAVIAFSPDSMLLAGCRVNGQGVPKLVAWNVRSEAPLANFTPHAHRCDALAFRPDGKTIVTFGYDGDLGDVATMKPAFRTWAIAEDGKSISTTPVRSLEQHLFAPNIIFGPGPDEMLVQADELGFHVHQVETGKFVRKAENRTGLAKFTSVGYQSCLSPDRKLLAIASGTKGTEVENGKVNGRLRLWELETGKLRHDLFQEDIARYASFSPDGKSIAVTTRDRSNPAIINIHDVGTGKLVRSIRGEFDFAAYALDGQLLAVSDKGIHFWRMRK